MVARAQKTRLKRSRHPADARKEPLAPEIVARVAEPMIVDLSLVDPRRILASIAADEGAPATARVAAAKALLMTTRSPDADIPPDLDELTRRALQKLTRRETLN